MFELTCVAVRPYMNSWWKNQRADHQQCAETRSTITGRKVLGKS